MMIGALLRTGSLDVFHPLGAEGSPVHAAAAQVRAAIARRLGQDVADTFAVPHRNEDGDTIDWYAPRTGTVVPWSAATQEERAAARDRLEEVRSRVEALGAEMAADPDPQRQVFARLLAHVCTFPADEHVYLVDGRPVVTFWGFQHHKAPAYTGALLDPDALAGQQARAGIPWWWWLIGLLALALLLLLLLGRGRGESPAGSPVDRPATEAVHDRGLPAPPGAAADPPGPVPDQSPAEEMSPAADGGPGPAAGASGRDWLLDGGGPVVDRFILADEGRAGRTTEADLRAAPVPAAPSAGLHEAMGADVGETSIAPDSDSGSSTRSPPEGTEAGALPDGVPANAAQRLEAGQGPAEAGSAAVLAEGQTPPGGAAASGISDSGAGGGEGLEPMVIPGEALRTGSVRFADGGWRSSTSLQDARGLPVRMGYRIDDGSGEIELRRHDGTLCAADVRVVMRDGRLVIDSQSDIVCPDGTNFGRPTLECRPGRDGRADCLGRYGTGERFSVDLGRLP
jgi:hypothetical protein